MRIRQKDRVRSTFLRAVLAAISITALLAGGTAVAEPISVRGVRDIDWHNAGFTVPAMGSCPAQEVLFSGGAGEAGNSVYRFTPDREIGYADVTGEGVEDALIMMDCGPRNSEYTSALIAMTTGEDGSVQPLGTVVNPDTWTHVPTDFTVWYGDIAAAITDIESGQRWTEYYRWAASARAFVRIDAS